jgi:hypothetical protein
MKQIIITESQFNLIIEDYHVSFNSRVWSEKLLRLTEKSQYDKFRINGKLYSDLYRQFPVDYFYIDKNSDSSGASYDEMKSGFNKNGEYCVYFVFGRNSLHFGAVEHELRHAYEDYKRQSNNSTKIGDTKELNRVLTNDLLNVIMGKHGYLGVFEDIFRSFYYTSKIEQSAYGENVFSGDKQIINTMKRLSSRNYIGALENQSTGRYWEKVKKLNIPILNSFKHYDQFIIWADKKIKQDAEKILKKFNKINYLKKQQ